jgi:uncharacterized protein (PEP-CTERM system associated)
MLILTTVVLFCASPVHAEFTLTPGVDLRVEYNDNIYLDSDSEEDDVITTVAPNLELTWQTARLDVSLFASIGMEKYLDHTEEDRIGADSTQSSNLDALARVYRDLLFLRVSDSYLRVPINESGRGGEGNRTTNLTDSNTFEFNPYLQFELMKNTRMQLGYTYQNLWYEEEAGDDPENFQQEPPCPCPGPTISIVRKTRTRFCVSVKVAVMIMIGQAPALGCHIR